MIRRCILLAGVALIGVALVFVSPAAARRPASSAERALVIAAVRSGDQEVDQAWAKIARCLTTRVFVADDGQWAIF